MATITLPKTEYEILERKAELYSQLLEKEEKSFPVEIYSLQRIREFLKGDNLSIKDKNKVKRILKNR